MKNYKCLAIGINRYHFLQPLSYAQADAQELQKFLQEEMAILPEQICLLTDTSAEIVGHSTYPNRENIIYWLNYLQKENLAGKSACWFFFSGYGIHFQGEDYLMPIDSNPRDMEKTAISMKWLLESLVKQGASKTLVILDINRSYGAVGGNPVGRKTLELASSLGIEVILSAQPHEFSHEAAALGHGIFTAALLEALRYHGKKVTLANLHQYLNLRLPQISEHHWRPIQTPIILILDTEASHEHLLPSQDSTAKKSSQRVSEPSTSVTFPGWIKPPSASWDVDFQANKEQIDPVQASSVYHQSSNLEGELGNSNSKEEYTVSGVSPRQYQKSRLIEDRNEHKATDSSINTGQSNNHQSHNSQSVNPNKASYLVKRQSERDFDLDDDDVLVTTAAPVDIPFFFTESNTTRIRRNSFPWKNWQLLLGGALTLFILLTVFSQFFEFKNNRQIAQESLPATTVNSSIPANPITKSSSTITESIISEEANVADVVDTSLSLDNAKTYLQSNQASRFSQAIDEALKIPPEDPRYLEAKTNISRWSQVILDIAQGRAKQDNYIGAIAAVQLIPARERVIYSRGQELMQQWQLKAEKQRINSVLIEAAKSLINPKEASSYSRAITTLRQLKPKEPGYTEAQNLTNQWSQQIYLLANARAMEGNFALAIQTATLVPTDSPMYEIAQKSIAQWIQGYR